MSEVKIMVAVPHAGHVEPMVYERLFMQEDEYGKRLDNSALDLVHFAEGYGIDEKRNDIARKFLDMGKYSHVLMLDSDVVMPLDAISKMLHEGRDVVSGYYARKTFKSTSCVVPLTTTNYENKMTLSEISERSEPFAVRAIGLGCALISRDVFERIDAPWFKYDIRDDGSLLSEDYWFCRKCIEHGVSVYVHPRIRCGHVKKEVL